MKKWLLAIALSLGLVSGARADTYINRVKPFTGVASQWPWQLNTDGTWTVKQPQYNDLANLSTQLWGTAQTITAPWTFQSAGTAKGLSTSQTPSGTPSADPNGIGWTPNHIYLPSFGPNVSGFPAGQQVASGLVVDVYPNNGFKGFAQAIHGLVNIPSSATVDTSQDWGYGGLQGTAQASRNLGGVLGTPRGSLFGAGLTATADASYLYGIVGAEADLITTSNATGLARRIGFSAVDLGGSGGGASIQGSLYDAAVSIGAISGATGWKRGILFSDMNGGAPLYSGGRLIASTGSATVNSFIDFSSYNCSGDGMFVHNLFLVDCSGNVSAAGYLKSPVMKLAGSSTGVTNIQTNNAGASNYTITAPAATDTMALIAAAQTLTNKTISGASNTISNIGLSSLTGLGTGVQTALGNAVDAASGLLTYNSIGTSGSTLCLANANCTFSGTINLTGIFQIGGLTFGSTAGGATPYIFFKDSAGNNSFISGGGGASPDASNYYRNTVHSFGDVGGGTTYAKLSPGLTVGSPTGGDKGLGTINAAAAYYANGTAGVTCNAGLGGTTRTINGIVTTC